MVETEATSVRADPKETICLLGQALAQTLVCQLVEGTKDVQSDSEPLRLEVPFYYLWLLCYSGSILNKQQNKQTQTKAQVV